MHPLVETGLFATAYIHNCISDVTNVQRVQEHRHVVICRFRFCVLSGRLDVVPSLHTLKEHLERESRVGTFPCEPEVSYSCRTILLTDSPCALQEDMSALVCVPDALATIRASSTH